MRGLGVAVVGSVVVHAAVLVWVTTQDVVVPADGDVAPPPAPPPAIAPAVDASSEPISVVFLADPVPNTSGEVIAASEPPARRGGSGRRGTGDESPGTGSNGSSSEGTSRSPYMTMRRPGGEPLRGPSGSFLDDFLSRSKPLPPPPDIPGERVNDEIAELRAKLKRAGRYSPEELASMRGQLVILYDERDAEELKVAAGGTYRSEKPTFRAKVAADGTVKLEDKQLDGQDQLMKEHGIDPYGRAKLEYLDRTRDQRVAIGRRFREQELKKSVVYMQQHIARLSAMTTDVARRKQGLFELWDECAETGTPEEVAGGEAARAFVLAHIRATVRYTPDELRALNARRQSKQVFAP